MATVTCATCTRATATSRSSRASTSTSRTASSWSSSARPGCGKSTLLRMIAGLEEITSGDLTIDGERVNDVPPAERGLAMVFQTYALYPHMTVADNMAFSAAARRRVQGAAHQKVREAARVLQLDQLLDRKPKALSGGQRQRVAIGRAIVREPKVFLFDEPLSNLDAALRVQMRIELARLHDELKATMIYVTHDQVEAMTMADKIVVLQGGVVEQAGTPLELYHHPEQPVRRRLHRQPQDELPADQGRGGRRHRRHGRPARRRPGDVPVQPGRPQGRRQRDARRPPRAPAAGRCRRDCTARSWWSSGWAARPSSTRRCRTRA